MNTPPSSLRRHRWPAWLATLALAVHLLAPGLCLAQMLSAAPLGGVCTASPQAAPGAATLQPGERAPWHTLEACDHCVASSAAMVDSTAPAADIPSRTAAAHTFAAPSPFLSSTAWRPPPRGPPHAA